MPPRVGATWFRANRFAVGALLAGAVADLVGLAASIWVVAGITALSGLASPYACTRRWETAARELARSPRRRPGIIKLNTGVFGREESEMLDLSSRLSNFPAVRGRAPWPNHEYVKGWGVFGLPFDSGHILALRVFPENDFGPYCTLWHRDPNERWSIYVDGPRLDTACPRYYGAACEHTGYAHLGLTWTGQATLRVTMDAPSLDWTLTASSTPLLSTLNAISAALPVATWRPRSLVRARERLASALGMGHMEMAGVMPSGHTGTLMPQRMYFIEDSRAVLDGVDLGRPARVQDNPKIGNVPLPARGVLAIGQAVWQILDPVEYERTRSETTGDEERS